MAYQFDYINTLINITSPQDEVDIQELIDTIRDEEASQRGIAYSQIANATGKQALSEGVEVGITVELLNGWQLKFWAGNYVATISGGNLVGGLGGVAVAYTAGVQVLLILSASSTLVETGTSGLTDEESDKLFSIPGDVWDEQLSTHTDSGSTGEALSDLLVSIEDALGLIGENTDWSGLAFDSNDNLISAVITQYTDNTLAVERTKWQLTATYDVDSRLTSYQMKEY